MSGNNSNCYLTRIWASQMAQWLRICHRERPGDPRLWERAGDPGSIPGSGRTCGEGIGNTLPFSSLGHPMDRRADGLQSIGLQKSWT